MTSGAGWQASYRAGSDWRVSDADREAVAGLLREHYAAGRLTMDEFHARLDAAYAAVTTSELAQVTVDLPGIAPGPGAGMAASAGFPGATPFSANPYRSASRDSSAGPRRRRRGRARRAALLALALFTGYVTASVLIGVSLPHGGLVAVLLLLMLIPVVLLTALAAAAVWIGRRAWRSGAWLEAVPAAAGAPWLGRLIWVARAVLVGRTFWRIGGRVGRPLRSRRPQYQHAQY